jgi:hypothetical protein
MNQRFVLKNAITNLYLCGFYENKFWTEDILESYIFDNRREMEDFIHYNTNNELEHTVLQVIEIWK